MIEQVFIAEYNDCIHESQHTTISVHKTKRGAETAIIKHYNERAKYWEEILEDIEDYDERNNEIGDALKMENWRVREMKLEE